MKRLIIGLLFGILATDGFAYYSRGPGEGRGLTVVNAAGAGKSAEEVIRATGPACGTIPSRFSTKYQDDETGLLYYGYRYYDARQGRWLSRDPIDEEGGRNLYAFSINNPENAYDGHGLCAIESNLCESPCSGKLKFTMADPVAVANREDLRAYCGKAAACAHGTVNLSKEVECKKCEMCGWKLIINITTECKMFYADPNHIRVHYEPPDIEQVVNHEKCHCEDMKQAFQDMISARTHIYYSADSCEMAKKSFEQTFQAEMQKRFERTNKHKDKKYEKGGRCYARGSVLQ